MAIALIVVVYERFPDSAAGETYNGTWDVPETGESSGGDTLSDPGQFYRRILHYFAYRCGDINTAEDLTHDTLLKALQNADSFHGQGEAGMAGWLYRIGHNAWVDELRRQARQAAPYEIEPVCDHAQPLNTHNLLGTDPQEWAVYRMALEEVIGYLDSNQEWRDLVEDIFFYGMSQEEHAVSKGIEVGTVKSRLNRLRQALKNARNESVITKWNDDTG